MTASRHPNTHRRYDIEGPGAFGDIELLALLLGSARSPALQAATDLIQRFGDLSGLARLEPAQLRSVPGIGHQRALRLHVALQVGRRALVPPFDEVPCICTPEQAMEQLRPRLQGLADEQLHALFLDRRQRLLALRCLTVGSDRYTVVDPRQIFKIAVVLGASGVILAHNHPSGDPTPSEQDRQITRQVAAAGQILGIQLLDHLVVGRHSFRSLAEEGLLVGMAGSPAMFVATD